MNGVNVITATLANLRAQFWTRARANVYEVAGWLIIGFVDWRIAVGLVLLHLSVQTRLRAAAMGGGL